MDIGRGCVVELPREETERRWNATTWQWPIMHAVLYGVTRDQMMAKHKANHDPSRICYRRRSSGPMPSSKGLHGSCAGREGKRVWDSKRRPALGIKTPNKPGHSTLLKHPTVLGSTFPQGQNRFCLQVNPQIQLQA